MGKCAWYQKKKKLLPPPLLYHDCHGGPGREWSGTRGIKNLDRGINNQLELALNIKLNLHMSWYV